MDFGVGLLSRERCGCDITGVGGVVSDVLCVWLLVRKAGPSFTEVVSLLMGALIGETNLERQSAALFLAPEIHSKVMLYYLEVYYLHFFHLEIWLEVCGHF